MGEGLNCMLSVFSFSYAPSYVVNDYGSLGKICRGYL